MQLDLRTVLPLTRAALDAGQLQAQTQKTGDGKACLYAGPCAIGVAIPADKAAELDERDGGSSISQLIQAEIVKVPEGQASDFTRLQRAHDGWTTCKAWERERYEAEFRALLAELEVRYGRIRITVGSRQVTGKVLRIYSQDPWDLEYEIENPAPGRGWIGRWKQAVDGGEIHVLPT